MRSSGPLFANNCFVFEDLNGFIVSHIHGTQGVDTQIIQVINFIQAIPILLEQFAVFDDEVYTFLNYMRGNFHKSWQCIQDGIFRIDSVKDKIVSRGEFLAISQKYNILSCSVRTWLRIYIKHSASYVYASTYKKLIRRNQSVIKYLKHGDL